MCLFNYSIAENILECKDWELSNTCKPENVERTKSVVWLTIVMFSPEKRLFTLEAFFVAFGRVPLFVAAGAKTVNTSNLIWFWRCCCGLISYNQPARRAAGNQALLLSPLASSKWGVALFSFGGAEQHTYFGCVCLTSLRKCRLGGRRGFQTHDGSTPLCLLLWQDNMKGLIRDVQMATWKWRL